MLFNETCLGALTMKAFLILTAALALSGCALLGGEHYVMSYGVETTANDSSNEFTVNATISGR